MKLAIDAGHGMSNRQKGVYDPGACAGGVSEADIALQWALTLKWVCIRNGIDCFLTRPDDRDSNPVAGRDDEAKAHGCTHFLSIHCNATAGAHGTEVFYRDPGDISFGKKVLEANVKAMEVHDRGLKHESKSNLKRLAVLNFAGPACLLEIGFIDNAAERNKMLDRRRRIAFAEELVKKLKESA